MEQLRTRARMNSSAYFDGSNYPYQKAQMKYFLKVNEYGI